MWEANPYPVNNSLFQSAHRYILGVLFSIFQNCQHCQLWSTDVHKHACFISAPWDETVDIRASCWQQSRKAGEMASRPKYSYCPLTQSFSLQHFIPHGSTAGEKDSDREGTGEWEPLLLKQLCGAEKWKAMNPGLNPPFSCFTEGLCLKT